MGLVLDCSEKYVVAINIEGTKVVMVKNHYEFAVSPKQDFHKTPKHLDIPLWTMGRSQVVPVFLEGAEQYALS